MPHVIAKTWGRPRACKTGLDPGKWELMDSNDEKLFARRGVQNKSIDIMNFESKRGWGKEGLSPDEYNDAFIAVDSYPCGELTVKNPDAGRALEGLDGGVVKDFEASRNEQIAVALFRYGYNHRSQENLPIFDDYDGIEKLPPDQLDAIHECALDGKLDCSLGNL